MRLSKNSLSFTYFRQWKYFKGLDYFKFTKCEYRTCVHYGFMFLGVSIAKDWEEMNENN